MQYTVEFIKKHNLFKLTLLVNNCLSESQCGRNCNSTCSCTKCHKCHNFLLCFEKHERNSTAMRNAKNYTDKEMLDALAVNESRQILNADTIPFKVNNQNQSFPGTVNRRSSNVKTVLLSTVVVYKQDKFDIKFWCVPYCILVQ